MIVRTCPHCSHSFETPDKRQRYCSKTCALAVGRVKLARLRVEGKDPTHGGKAAQARRESLAGRRAAEELLGRALTKARREARAKTQSLIPGGPQTEVSFRNSNVSNRSTHQVATIQQAAAAVKPGYVPDNRLQVLHTDEEGTPTGLRLMVPIAEIVVRKQYWAESIHEKSVWTVAGRGWSIKVDAGRLEVRQGHEGKTLSREPRRLARGVRQVQALLAVDLYGTITGEAMQWLKDQRIGFFMLDRDGELMSAVVERSPFLPLLRRAQYNADALALARHFIDRKVRAGAQVRPLAQARMLTTLEPLPTMSTLEYVRLLEARAALAYWEAWAFELKFAGKNFPTDWRRFSQRSSQLTGSPRKATHPVNAVLNYAYGVLAGQVQRALSIAGLDVAVGHLHADQDGRPSLVYDVMEPLRPLVDEQVLPWVQSVKWRRADFSVDRSGLVRLNPQLARAVVLKAMLPDKVVRAEVKEYVRVIEAASC